MDMNLVSSEVSHSRRGFRSSQKPTQQFDNVSFGHFLDAFNPLNHIPVLSSLKEDVNPVAPIAKMTGGMLLGGPIGLAFSAVDVVINEATGKSMLGNAIHAAFGEEEAAPTQTEVAVRRYRSLADAHKRHLHTWRA